jgi:hypothetical protein
MNLQEIENRIHAIKNEMDATKANFAKLEGHLQEANHWREQLLQKDLEQPEQPNEPEQPEDLEQPVPNEHEVQLCA